MHIQPQATIQEEAQRRLESFKREVVVESLDSIWKKYVLNAQSIVLTQTGKFSLCKEFEMQFGVQSGSLVFVGSSVIGFSANPKSRFRLFDMSLSDIDVAIVSPEFFVDLWDEIHLFDQENKYWPKKHQFERYLLMGWLRPDKFPGGMFFEWFDFFRKLRQSPNYGGLKITAGVYPSLQFLRSYQINSIDECRKEIEGCEPAQQIARSPGS